MESPITWSVGRRLAAITGIGLVTTAAVAGVALQGVSEFNYNSALVAPYLILYQ